MDVSKIAKLLGKLGGKKTLEKKGRKHFSGAGKKGMIIRWGTKYIYNPSDEELKNPVMTAGSPAPRGSVVRVLIKRTDPNDTLCEVLSDYGYQIVYKKSLIPYSEEEAYG